MGPLLWDLMARSKQQVAQAPEAWQTFKGQGEAGKETPQARAGDTLSLCHWGKPKGDPLLVGLPRTNLLPVSVYTCATVQ